jgi:hypothetical protein
VLEDKFPESQFPSHRGVHFNPIYNHDIQLALSGRSVGHDILGELIAALQLPVLGNLA